MFLNAELFDVSKEVAYYKECSGGPDTPEAKLLDEYYAALQSGEFSRWGSGHVIAGYEKGCYQGDRRADP